MIRRISRVVRALSLVLVLSTAGVVSSPLTLSTQSTVSASLTLLAPPSIKSTSGYSYGYGTYYVAMRREVPPNWGSAKTWYAYAQRDGYSVSDTPKKGAIAWTGEGALGQVAIVEDISADGVHVTISEMNGEGGWNRVVTRTAPSGSFRYIH